MGECADDSCSCLMIGVITGHRLMIINANGLIIFLIRLDLISIKAPASQQEPGIPDFNSLFVSSCVPLVHSLSGLTVSGYQSITVSGPDILTVVDSITEFIKIQVQRKTRKKHKEFWNLEICIITYTRLFLSCSLI